MKDESMSPEAARAAVFALAGGPLLDADGHPMKRGTYIRTTDSVQYSITCIEAYRFHASTARCAHVIPQHGTDLIAYRAFARELRRLENAAA